MGRTPDDHDTAQREGPKLNVDFISKWIEDEGYDNNELAKALNISVRAVSSV